MPEIHATRPTLALVLKCDDHPDTSWSNMSQSEVNSFRFIKWNPEFVTCLCISFILPWPPITFHLVLCFYTEVYVYRELIEFLRYTY